MSTCRVIERFCSTPDPDGMRELTAAFRGGASDEDVALLARGLATSGTCLTRDPRSADVASTGGPSSLSTLLCPLYLRSHGWTVPKLGVPGRPAGGVDVLGTIPGYRVRLEASEVKATLVDNGYAHFLADESWAPLDLALFRYRQETGAQNVPELVIASLLAKKLAVGVHRAGLEVRVGPHGNFGADFDAARQNARRLVNVAGLVDIEAICVLSDATRPYQPYIGRGESLVALDLVFGARTPAPLQRHDAFCSMVSAAVVGVDDRSTDGRVLRDHFISNVEAQGGSGQAFADRVAAVREAPRAAVTARRDGYTVVDLRKLRPLVVEENSRAALTGAFSDAAGLILSDHCWSHVRAGDVVAMVRGMDEQSSVRLAARLAGCFRQLPEPRRQRDPEVISGG